MNNRDYNDPMYKKWILAVFRRDKFRCQRCKSNKKLEAHHIQSWSKCPDLRFSLSNGITLCRKCHDEIRGNEEAWEPLCRVLQNKDLFLKMKLKLREMKNDEG